MALPAGISSLLSSKGAFCGPDFASGAEGRDWLVNARVLIIGAGGLGCELLKTAALSGIKNNDVIDLDVIDLTNLNRQFLFRKADVGKPKAEVAAAFIRKRCPGVNINAHFCKIQDFGIDFYKQFQVVIGGLDSIEARSWINNTLVSIARESNNQLVIPYIDGGTESWAGHVKYIQPNVGACFDCQRDLFTPEEVYQESTFPPYTRQPEHCVAWAKEVLWPKERPNQSVDGDNDDHIAWIYEKAVERAAQFKIEGVTLSLTKGVVKNIVPAIAATQAVIASMCITEAIKCITQCGPPINNNLLFNGQRGAMLNHFLHDKDPNCPACSRKLTFIPKVEGETVEALLKRLAENFDYPASSLSVDSVMVYMPIMAHTQANLTQPVSQFAGPGSNLIATAKGREMAFEFQFEEG
jgi:ubiquitin-activating enzyme E1 C